MFMPTVFDNDFFNFGRPKPQRTPARSNYGAQARCCNDPYCENNHPRAARRPQTSQQQRSPFAPIYEDDSFFGFPSRKAYGRPQQEAPAQPRVVRRPATSQFASQQQPRMTQSYVPKQTNEWWAEDSDKENQVPQNPRVDPMTSHTNIRSQRVNRGTPQAAQTYTENPNAAPKFHSTKFESNHVNRNGNSTTLNRKVVTKNDTKETTITEDKAGNRNVENIHPYDYQSKLAEILASMEESGQVIREVSPAIEADQNKMIEESPSRDSLGNDSNCSNTDSGNMLFDDIKF